MRRQPLLLCRALAVACASLGIAACGLFGYTQEDASVAYASAEERELLEIPEPWATCAFVPIGRPVATGHGPLSRRPVEDVAFCNRFGEALFPSATEDSP